MTLSLHQVRYFLLAIFVSINCGMLCVAEDTKQKIPESAALEFFEKKVRPLLVAKCYECHSEKDVNGGLRLDSKQAVAKGGDTGAVVIPGKPDESLLIEAIRYENRDLQMPPKNRLTNEEVLILEKWVAIGAPDPRNSSPIMAGPTGMSIEEGRQFWSLKPVSNPDVPSVKETTWVNTPVDNFVLRRLEDAGLAHAPKADKRTLIRRATLDLIGLPPTVDEIKDFLADDSPDAFQKVTGRLLASPQYGARWGRHWLDVARYADSNGLDENLAFGNAWRYRDYVVNSFNSDKPFHRFVIEQLAGDLVPGANRETRIATGYLSLGAKVLAEPDKEKLFMDTIDEQLDSTGKAFFAMTIGCARCHDHKFDPLKQADYYSLAAIFKSTRTFGDTQTGVIKHWYEHKFATAEELERLKAVDAEIDRKKSAANSYKSAAVSKIRTEARSKVIEYLIASVGLSPNPSLTDVAVVAKQYDLHPRILHHCRLHIEYHRDTELYAEWHAAVSSGKPEDAKTRIEKHYRPLFDRAAKASKEDKKGDAKNDDLLKLAISELNDTTGLLAVPSKPEFALDPETLKEYYRLKEEARLVESHAPDVSASMGVSDGDVLASLPIHIRGSHRNLGTPVPRDFPQVMRTSSTRPILPRNQSGRLEFARWAANTQHPLTARVFVNRVWRWHFGAGLVRTTENFGKLGDRPSHPKLLDWFARQFMQSGWAIKDLHRLIMSSSVYQMDSIHPEQGRAAKLDPENRLLWKFQMQRLEAEQVRDSILASSGRLDKSLGGKTIPLRNRQFVFDHTSIDHTKYDSLRRAIYLPVVRNNLYPMFAQFDFPDPTMPTGSRSTTVVAPQALLLMNSTLVMDSADELAKSLLAFDGNNYQRVHMAYERTLGRLPSAKEAERAVAFIANLNNRLQAKKPSSNVVFDGPVPAPPNQPKAWSMLCQSLFATNEFIYVR